MPAATLVIVTRNRCDELRRALVSATAQDAPVEVIVVDDGSDDATAQMVRTEFPDVVLVRFETRAGLVVRRNDAAKLANGDVIVSIDDDAVFSSTRTVAQTLREFDHPRIAAIAIPYDDIEDGQISGGQRPPTTPGHWVVPTFRGTAHALRRDVFLALGGFREEIVHQGEEDDFCIRLLAAGYVVALGRADRICHYPSRSRDVERMAVYSQRNMVLWCFRFFPFPLSVAMMVGYAGKGLVIGRRHRMARAMIRGLASGLRESWAARDERRPLSWRIAMLDRHLRRHRALPLEELERLLPPLAAT